MAQMMVQHFFTQAGGPGLCYMRHEPHGTRLHRTRKVARIQGTPTAIKSLVDRSSSYRFLTKIKTSQGMKRALKMRLWSDMSRSLQKKWKRSGVDLQMSRQKWHHIEKTMQLIGTFDPYLWKSDIDHIILYNINNINNQGIS